MFFVKQAVMATEGNSANFSKKCQTGAFFSSFSAKILTKVCDKTL